MGTIRAPVPFGKHALMAFHSAQAVVFEVRDRRDALPTAWLRLPVRGIGREKSKHQIKPISGDPLTSFSGGWKPPATLRFVIYDSRFAIYDFKTHAARKSYIVNQKSEMKLLVFAHTPPPHHGQSYMVKLMLEGFGGDARRRHAAEPHPLGIECYHVNARFSRGLADVGTFQGTKLFLILWFCLQALWIHFRYGVENFYYIPAPGKRVALYRDWLVMWLCRPFFKRIILHWHAAGLAKWLETETTIYARGATWRAFRPVDLSIVLSRYNLADAQKLLSRQVVVVDNGIPDPCPDFDEKLLPRRRARARARIKLHAGEMREAGEAGAAGNDPQIVKILYLAHCIREKGLFDALEGVITANARLEQSGSPLRLHLDVAGEFVSADEQTAFRDRLNQLKPAADGQPCVHYLGFVTGPEKHRVFAESDLFCFPTYYPAESFGLVVVEAMAFGLPIVTTRWRSIPELFPGDYAGLVEIRSPDQIADALIRLATGETDCAQQLRTEFKHRFALKQHLTSLAAALRSVE
jgi:glycosyltransferase involved in cell wall biosynthesis